MRLPAWLWHNPSLPVSRFPPKFILFNISNFFRQTARHFLFNSKNIFSGIDKCFSTEYTLLTFKSKTDDADEYTDVASPRELPVVRWQQKRPRRMDCGGRTEQSARLSVSTDGLFPRYQGKTCDGTSPSGRVIVNLGGTAEVSDFCPKGTIGMGPCGTKVFLFSQRAERHERSKYHG